MSAVAVRDLRKSYGDHEALRGIEFDDRARARCSACSGRTARGRRRPSRSSRATASGTRAGRGARRRPAGREPGLARARRRRAPVLVALHEPQCRREPAALRRLLHDAARPRGGRRASSVSPRRRDARVRTLSGGQKRRLDLGLALVGDPELLFLDEPTTGFDPGARRAAWETIRDLRSLGKTILLTTHYLDEAEQLADRVAVLNGGVIVREGAPSELTARRDGDRDPVSPRRPRDRGANRPADTQAERADGRGARRAAESSRGSRCGDRPSRRSTWSSPPNEPAALHPRAQGRAEALLAKPGGGVLHLPAPDPLLPHLRLDLRQLDDHEGAPARRVLPRGGDDRLRRRLDVRSPGSRSRRSCDARPVS